VQAGDTLAGIALFFELSLEQLLSYNGLSADSVPSVGQVLKIPPPTHQMREKDRMWMVYVPAGQFQMGGPEEIGTGPGVHTVTLDGYWLDRTEVTNTQYEKCVTAGACQAPICSSQETTYGDSSKATHPVMCVDWYRAQAYCQWVGGRPPTEAEWEYAARGPQGWDYPWGDTFDGIRLNYCDRNCESDTRDASVDDGYARTAPVGSYPEGTSWCGALDMAGNVTEWVADWYGPYPSAAQSNPTGPQSGSLKVLRGGSFFTVDSFARSASRYWTGPDSSVSTFGFRCVVPSTSSP
jgi:formylglycine-generating enzyme required for sulfatase activity